MSSKVPFQPQGYHTLTPYPVVRNAAKAIDFYKQVFDAEEMFRMPGEGGKIGHAELKIGDSVLMLADEHPPQQAFSPESVGGTPLSVLIYVADVDKVFNAAVAAGAKVLAPVETKFYGDRMGGIVDPFGHKWYISTHVEDVSPEEMERRAAAMGKK